MKNVPNVATRAKRFPIHASVRYRVASSADWHNGRMENVSCSGVLIAGRHRLMEEVPVEMILPLPPQLSGAAAVQVLCRGRVVRTTVPALPIFRQKFAVRWRELSLVNGDRHAVRQAAVKNDWQALIHDMYNEIAVIVGNSELLLDPHEARRQQRVVAIKHSSDRAVKLLDRLALLLQKRNHRD
jgi:signal transduction histidine kinase